GAGGSTDIAAIGSEDLSDIIFTSGTTGSPKGVMATHAQSLRVFETWSEIVGLIEGDRYLIVNPFFHTFGYKAGILACLMRGATTPRRSRTRRGARSPAPKSGWSTTPASR